MQQNGEQKRGLSCSAEPDQRNLAMGELVQLVRLDDRAKGHRQHPEKGQYGDVQDKG